MGIVCVGISEHISVVNVLQPPSCGHVRWRENKTTSQVQENWLAVWYMDGWDWPQGDCDSSSHCLPMPGQCSPCFCAFLRSNGHRTDKAAPWGRITVGQTPECLFYFMYFFMFMYYRASLPSLSDQLCLLTRGHQGHTMDCYSCTDGGGGRESGSSQFRSPFHLFAVLL